MIIRNKDLAESKYVSPRLKVVEIDVEGVLCQSGNFTLPNWEYDNEEQDFGW